MSCILYKEGGLKMFNLNFFTAILIILIKDFGYNYKNMLNMHNCLGAFSGKLAILILVELAMLINKFNYYFSKMFHTQI